MAPVVRLLNPDTDSSLVPYLAALHANCITSDHTIATFLPPLSHDKLLTWWKDSISAVVRNESVMFLLFDEAPLPMSGSADMSSRFPLEQFKGSNLMGVVILAMLRAETGPFRAQVDKLLVSPKFRRRGGATALMKALEQEAAKRGQTLLMLNAESGSSAETLYRQLGWTEIGQVPNHDISPDGGLRHAIFFYKQLSK
ncbi:hypothetical protein Cpir12675_001063 [Ceratocystis pirilliformis]|uniref:N-acetyltransferase domain-containing protein n=1 Tax=Ceratocystis pirilliformis TaxID=259994 RepID=A0ABR3ZKK4_9PEZI